MRLLDARKLELVDVRDDAVPPYAILSHTWGDKEITLQELRHMKGRMPSSLDKRKRTIADMQGFLKVRDAAALAVMRGYSYIWVDTCCIDKSSSAELSEAINSMYLWYQQAEECYAYLSDVNSAKDEGWAKPNSSLRRSRWFTRGWTLQELIAPKAVHFYAKDWSLRIISSVTGIDGEVLDGRIDPLQLSVSARMKWASHRHTTRLEDMAYSLMGLFQVNMPLLYGEGPRAFTRLQEEIIQRTDDQSLYAWHSFDNAEEDPDALVGLLAHSPAQFKGAGNIQPLPPSPVYASAPSGITNHGLRVQIFTPLANGTRQQ
ncbi:HET-domain-containing protein [Cadophora sp. DSE1049]|nr:HET-domain-containing protein [Cadophora sp. DSE1049]